MRSNSVQRICLFRLSALGDISHVIPVVRAISEHHPEATIDWIIAPHCIPLVPDIERLRMIAYDKHAGWRAIRAMRADLLPRYDILLHLQTSLRANLLSQLIRARRRIGWDQQRAREGHRWCINASINEHPPQHQVQGFLAFARALDCPVREPSWRLQVTQEARQFARSQLPDDRKVLVISPCSSHPLRNWSAAGYAAIADYAHNRLGWAVCVTGGGSKTEVAMADQIVQLSNAPIINLTGKDTLPQLMAVLQQASALLSPDAGPVHWANALGTPVIGLYAATRAARSGPYNSLNYCVDRYDEAARKYEKCAADALRWGKRVEHPGVMDLIQVEAVQKKLQQLADDLGSAN